MFIVEELSAIFFTKEIYVTNFVHISCVSSTIGNLRIFPAKEECGFPGGRFCLWRVLKEMGFTYKKRDNKKYIYEQTNILEQRHTYLQTIRKLRQEHKNLVYTDETWVNAHHNNEYIWLDSDGSGGWKVPSGKGRRLIILHAGGVDGWVEGADLVFRSKTNLWYPRT